jgi:hypothetical protein
MTSRLTRSRFAPFAISLAVTCVFFIDFCSWMFQCGCRSLWAGADALCNIHLPAAHHCPWCSHGAAGYAVVLALVAAPQLAVAVRRPGHWAAKAAIGVAAGALSGAVTALGFGWLHGYWL